MICIRCPVGCDMTVENDGRITGGECPAGEQYAREELRAPKRNITTNVRVQGGTMPMLSVKTSAPIPKGLIFDVVKVIHAQRVTAPIRLGDVILSNVCESGVDIVATRDVDVVL